MATFFLNSEKKAAEMKLREKLQKFENNNGQLVIIRRLPNYEC